MSIDDKLELLQDKVDKLKMLVLLVDPVVEMRPVNGQNL